MLSVFSRNLHDRQGTAAVEFAFVAPLFLLMLFGVIVFGSVISTYQSVEQITAEGARAGIPGNSDAERDQLARTAIASILSSYPFITPAKVSIATETDAAPARFKVSITYDMSGSFIFGLGGIVPIPSPKLTRSAVVLLTATQT